MDKKIETKSAAGNAGSDEMSLEESLAKLEKILERMEDGDMPLEELLKEYETGVELVKFCQGRLDAVEKRIQVVSRSLDGTLEMSEFSEEKE